MWLIPIGLPSTSRPLDFYCTVWEGPDIRDSSYIPT